MSGIVISIKAGATVEESSVTATGSLVNIIADSERTSFGIGSDADLKRAIGKYFGKEPYYAYLKSPTPPFGDIYKKYGWSQVQRVLRPIKAQILGIKTKPSILSINTLKNESNKTATFTTKISEQVTDTVSTEWSNSSKISVQQKFSYNFKFFRIGVDGETTFGFEHAWGKSETVSKQTTATTETGVSVELKPGESALVELSANSGKMQVRITYEAHLIGATAVNYYWRYRDHYFWSLPIQGVVDGSNQVQVVEDIEVGYYSNASIKVKNSKTNEEMMFYMADHPSEHPSDDQPGQPPCVDHPYEPPTPDNPDEPPPADHPDDHPFELLQNQEFMK